MATSRSPNDVSGNATAPLSHWLAPALIDWLHTRGCHGVTLLDPDAPRGDDSSDDGAPHWQDEPQRGWQVPLGDAAGSRVLLAFDARENLATNELNDVAALFERLRAFPLVPDTRDAVLVDHGEVRRVIHDLRNGLNTLLINGSLLARAVSGQPSLQRSAQFLEGAGLACADHLNRLSELTARASSRSDETLFADRPQVDGAMRDLL